ncbi:RloB family protein [Legionella sainthelensi]|uniref:RloB family protein n=1 Tax=Legionella sainthelensi TaxID=28087 RepID=UPI000E1FDD09|nr:RloB family protein [Legionella sainthelensi]
MSKKRKFTREIGQKKYRKLFVIAAEGRITEPQYFARFNGINTSVIVKCLKANNQSSPRQILKRINRYLQSESISSTDQAWIVVDKDSWEDQQLMQLYNWSKTQPNYGVALTNPNFEYWILLHFEEGHNIGSIRDISTRLKNWIPNYNKSLEKIQIDANSIQEAIQRAKIHDNPPCEDWPRNFGCTTVYKLVEKIIIS